MRIHTDKLTRADMLEAIKSAGVDFIRLEERGSRTRARAFDFILTGSGRHGTQGSYGDMTDRAPKSGTWDEWGIVLGELFRRDPAAVVPHVYDSGEHFRWATGGRFDTLTPAAQHIRHRWQYDGRCVTGAYYVSTCACGAVRRWMADGYDFGATVGGAA